MCFTPLLLLALLLPSPLRAEAESELQQPLGLRGFLGTVIQPQVYVPHTACGKPAQRALDELKKRNDALWRKLSRAMPRERWNARYAALHEWLDDNLSPCHRAKQFAVACRSVREKDAEIGRYAKVARSLPLRDEQRLRWRQLELAINEQERSVIPAAISEARGLSTAMNALQANTAADDRRTRDTVRQLDDCPEVVRQYLDTEGTLRAFIEKHRAELRKLPSLVSAREDALLRKKIEIEAAIAAIGLDTRLFKDMLSPNADSYGTRPATNR